MIQTKEMKQLQSYMYNNNNNNNKDKHKKFKTSICILLYVIDFSLAPLRWQIMIIVGRGRVSLRVIVIAVRIPKLFLY